MSQLRCGVGQVATRLVMAVALVGCKAEPKQQPKDAVGRAAEIEADLAKVRELSLQAPVPVAFQSATDFRAFMHRAVADEGKSMKAETEAYVKLGLITPATDLGSAVENAYATQAAAYYDPKAKRFFIVMPPDNLQTRDILCAHELTHALQDQHFDLTRYIHDAPNGDARIARKFVVEGDAMLASIAFLVADKTHVAELSPEQIRAMRTKLEQFANADPKAMAAMLKQQASSTKMDPQLQKALDSLDSIPPAILVPLLDSYMKGVVVALDAYEQHGWQSVDALFTDPPESTEQVLDPEGRLFKHVDHPHKVTLPSFDGYTVVWSDVLGELEWSVYFSLWKHAGDGNEAVNWGGDRYAVLRDPDGELTAVVATTWDTEYDAKVFYDAYVSTLATRYGGKTEEDGGEALVTHGEDQTWVKWQDQHVYVVDGPDWDHLADELLDGVTFD